MATFADIDVRLMLGRLRPWSEYRWIGARDTGHTSLTDCIAEWRDSQNVQPTEAELLAEWDVYQAEAQAAQAQAQQRDTDVRALRQATAALNQIAADRTTLAADLAALAGATTAERWAIVGRALAVLDRCLNREETEIRVVVRLARRYLNEE